MKKLVMSRYGVYIHLMDKERARDITADISYIINMQAPFIEYTDDEIEGDEYEYVMERFCRGLGLYEAADEEYIRIIFKEGRLLDAESFMNNPYIRDIHFADRKIGDYLLTSASYDRGEFLQRDMPDIVPRLGFFREKVTFPGIYEGNVPWMSVCPSEIETMSEPANRASGRVLVLGLGLGYYPYIISLKDEVEHIDIVELSSEVIEIFEKEIFPQFSTKDKIRIIHDDAIEYMKRVESGQYDFIFSDIWENQYDGAIAYRKIKEHEERLQETQFMYWIEKQIEEYLTDGV